MTIRGEVGEGAAEQGCLPDGCPIAQARCAAERPRLDPLDAHGVACHFAAEAAARYVRARAARRDLGPRLGPRRSLGA